MNHRIAIVCAALWAGCAPSEAEVRRDFDELIARSNACEVAADCTSVSPGCPLGCIVALNRTHAEEVERRARELIADYERAGRSCQYECIVVGPLACSEGKCVFESTP